jgi:predicted nucleotidyltransferase
MQRTPELLRLLLDAGVEFVIIGGVAAIAYGSATFTQDFDITVSFSEENLARLLAALAPYHPRYALAVPKRPVTEAPAELSANRNLSLDDLITVKHHLGRDKDRLVERELLALRARQQTEKP